MKKLLYTILLTSAIWSAGAKENPYFPLSLAPESVQSLRIGASQKQLVSGVELSLHGDKEKSWLEGIVGDWSEFNHSFSVGYLTQNFETSVIYGSIYVFMSAWDSIGVGLKQIAYYDTYHEVGERLKGETTLFAFYQFPNRNLLFSKGTEYLSLYVGFKSEISNYEKEHIAEIVEKAIDLYKISKNMVGGVFYSPDVSNGLFRGIGIEIGKKSYQGILYFSL